VKQWEWNIRCDHYRLPRLPRSFLHQVEAAAVTPLRREAPNFALRALRRRARHHRALNCHSSSSSRGRFRADESSRFPLRSADQDPARPRIDAMGRNRTRWIPMDATSTASAGGSRPASARGTRRGRAVPASCRPM